MSLGPLPDHIGYALRRAQVAVFQDFHRRFAGEDIRPAQYSLLLVLQHNPGLRQARASEALGIKRTNFVPLLDGLVRRGLAERRAAPDDRRASALYLTASGAALLHRLTALARAHEAQLTALLGTGDKAILLGLLRRLAPGTACDAVDD